MEFCLESEEASGDSNLQLTTILWPHTSSILLTWMKSYESMNKKHIVVTLSLGYIFCAIHTCQLKSVTRAYHEMCGFKDKCIDEHDSTRIQKRSAYSSVEKSCVKFPKQLHFLNAFYNFYVITRNTVPFLVRFN